jgi:DNA-binding NtrC family response regulator
MAPVSDSEKRTGTVLVVDDDNGVRGVLTKWVEAFGHTTKDAPDADSALEILAAGPVDVAICDIRMPGHDGAWLIDQMRQRYPRVAIVIATGLMELDPSVTLGPGVVGYLVKPFKRDALADLLDRALLVASDLRKIADRGPLLLDEGIIEGTIVSGE